MSDIDLNAPSDPEYLQPTPAAYHPPPPQQGPAQPQQAPPAAGPAAPDWESRWNREIKPGSPAYKPPPQPKPYGPDKPPPKGVIPFKGGTLSDRPPQEIPRDQRPYVGHLRPGERLTDPKDREILHKFGEERQIREREAHDLEAAKKRQQEQIDLEKHHEAEVAPLRQAIIEAEKKTIEDQRGGQEQLRHERENIEQHLEDAREGHNKGVLNGTWPAWKALMMIPMGLAFALMGRHGFRHSYAALSFLTSFTGAMAEGNKRKADESWKGYKEQAGEMMKQYKLKQEDLKETLQNDKLNIEEKKLELQLKLAEWGDKKTAEALESKGWEELDKITAKADQDVQKLQDSIDKIEDAKDKMQYKDENKLANDYAKDAEKGIQDHDKFLGKALALDKKIQASSNEEERKKLQDEQRYWHDRMKQVDEKTQKSIQAMTLARKHGSGKSKQQIDQQVGIDRGLGGAGAKGQDKSIEEQNIAAAKAAIAKGADRQAVMQRLQAAGIDPMRIFQDTGTAEQPQQEAQETPQEQ